MERTGRVALVVGASAGFGRATALELAKRGAILLALLRQDGRVPSLVEHVNRPPESGRPKERANDLSTGRTTRRSHAPETSLLRMKPSFRTRNRGRPAWSDT